MEKKYITIEQAQTLAKLEKFNPISKIQKAIGYITLGLGLITLPLPTGSIVLIMIGATLLGLSYKDILVKAQFIIKEKSIDIKTSKLFRGLK